MRDVQPGAARFSHQMESMRLHPSRLVIALTLSLVTASACHRHRASAPAPQSTPARSAPRVSQFRTGEDVLDAMHDRYVGKWYNTLTFTQKTSRLLPNGTWNVQTWYEAMRLPGRLRIDFDPITAGNGVLYARDSQFVVQNGRPLRGDPGINPLLVLGFDVYFSPASRTAARLRREGFDMTRVNETTFQGRPMLVVGARKGDYNRKQFWIDAERRGAAWIAPRVEIWTEGKLVFYEDYDDIRTNVTLDDALFEPAKWKTAKHWLTR